MQYPDSPPLFLSQKFGRPQADGISHACKHREENPPLPVGCGGSSRECHRTHRLNCSSERNDTHKNCMQQRASISNRLFFFFLLPQIGTAFRILGIKSAIREEEEEEGFFLDWHLTSSFLHSHPGLSEIFPPTDPLLLPIPTDPDNTNNGRMRGREMKRKRNEAPFFPSSSSTLPSSQICKMGRRKNGNTGDLFSHPFPATNFAEVART